LIEPNQLVYITWISREKILKINIKPNNYFLLVLICLLSKTDSKANQFVKRGVLYIPRIHITIASRNLFNQLKLSLAKKNAGGV
jgi:hypothetical protein